MIMDNNILTFWLSRTQTSKVYVLYCPPTSWKHTILAIVDLVSENVILKLGKATQDREFISKFNTLALSGNGEFVQIYNEGANSELVGHVIYILNSHQEDEFKLIRLHMKSLDYHYTMVDATTWSVDDIVSAIDLRQKISFKPGDIKKQYYCGITNDLDTRMEAHRNNDFSIENETVYAWNCATQKAAADVEGLLGEMGFDIGDTKTGGNGGTDDSTIVYLLKKGNAVK